MLSNFMGLQEAFSQGAIVFCRVSKGFRFGRLSLGFAQTKEGQTEG